MPNRDGYIEFAARVPAPRGWCSTMPATNRFREAVEVGTRLDQRDMARALEQAQPVRPRMLRAFLVCVAALSLVAWPARSEEVAAATRAPGARGTPAAGSRVKAVAFDFFVLFNPDSVVPEVERVFPGKGRDLTSLWRTRQFEYSWLRSLTGRYVDFFAVTEDALVYAANAMNLELMPGDKRRLLDAFLHLAPWPDTADALRRLKASGIRVITIANVSPLMLRANAENAGLIGFFDALVSTDINHTYKPDPRAYRLGLDRLHLAKREILFAAFGGWDAAGAKSFGYPTFWVNRFNQPSEELGSRPDHTSRNLDDLLDFVLSGAAAPTR